MSASGQELGREMHDDWIRHLFAQAQARPAHADVWCSLGHALHYAGRPSEALGAFDQALALNRLYQEAGIARCFLLADLSRPSDGYARLHPWLTMAPDDFATVLAIGVFAMRFGWYETGVSQLRRAASLAPRSAYAALLLASALDELGDNVGAVDERRRARELVVFLPTDAPEYVAAGFQADWPAPGLARAQVEFAKFLLQRGDDAGAKRELEAVNARLPGHAWVMVETALVQLLLDDPQQAERWLRAAVAVDSSCHRAHLELSFLLAARGEQVEATAHVRSAVELRPAFPDYRYHLGVLLLDSGCAAEAAVQLEQSLILNSGDGHCALAFAQALVASGRPDDGLAVLGMGAWRAWPESLVLSAELLTKAGRYDEARQALERMLELEPDYVAAIEALAALPG